MFNNIWVAQSDFLCYLGGTPLILKEELIFGVQLWVCIWVFDGTVLIHKLTRSITSIILFTPLRISPFREGLLFWEKRHLGLGLRDFDTTRLRYIPAPAASTGSQHRDTHGTSALCALNRTVRIAIT
jgi:hypothetical protein